MLDKEISILELRRLSRSLRRESQSGGSGGVINERASKLRQRRGWLQITNESAEDKGRGFSLTSCVCWDKNEPPDNEEERPRADISRDQEPRVAGPRSESRLIRGLRVRFYSLFVPRCF